MSDKTLHFDNLNGIKNIMTQAFATHSVVYPKSFRNRKGFFEIWFPYKQILEMANLDQDQDTIESYLEDKYLTYYYSCKSRNYQKPKILTGLICNSFFFEDFVIRGFFYELFDMELPVFFEDSNTDAVIFSETLGQIISNVKCHGSQTIYKEILLYLLRKERLYDALLLLLICGLLEGYAADDGKVVFCLDAPFVKNIKEQMLNDRYCDNAYSTKTPSSNDDSENSHRLNRLLHQTLADASDDHYEAMYKAGVMLFYGFNSNERNYNIDVNHKKAYELLKKVADSDSAYSTDAMEIISRMHLHGDVYGEERDAQAAYAYKVEAFNKNRTSTLLNDLLFLSREGFGSDFEYDFVDQLIENNDDIANDQTRKSAAIFYIRYGKYDKAIKVLTEMEMSDSFSEYRLGMIYLDGVHVTPPKPDPKLAEYYLEKAAKRGMPDAIYQIGILYFRGSFGHKVNLMMARDLFKEAADKGHNESLYHYGWMCRYGMGGSRDFIEAIKYFEKGADLGHHLCMSELGSLYLESEIQDYEKALIWIKKAINAGEKQSEFTYANMLLEGHGCKQDLNTALMYYKRALKNGIPGAKIILELLENDNKEY